MEVVGSKLQEQWNVNTDFPVTFVENDEQERDIKVKFLLRLVALVRPIKEGSV